MFQIHCKDLVWVPDISDNPGGLCLHGTVTVVIGNEAMEDEGAVSSTAVYLLKTLTENHTAGKGEYMIPCSGHLLMPNGALTEVVISGCAFGIDWTVEQISGGVMLTTASGGETFVPMDAYRAEIYRFADTVEAFYRDWAPENIYQNCIHRNDIAFWNEWHRRRGE